MEKLILLAEKYASLMKAAEEYIWNNPETGYKEFKTDKYMRERFTELGYELTRAEGITGFYTLLDTGKPGPTLLILGELDSVICKSHPNADKQTGAVHACGHHCQCSALLGIAAALKEDGVLDGLCGKIKLCAVPAEELLEIDYRSELIENGVISYYGGKTEFLKRGYFDDVDLAFMVHTGDRFYIGKGHVGCIAKRIIYKGTASHAGGSPWNGNNALYAATCGINAANSIRETFKESDIIRFHPIITEGGQMVNAIPDTVKIESYVRGKTYDGILTANKRINRALCGGALSLGANVEIVDMPGYAPEVHDENMIEVFKEAMALALPDEPVVISNDFSSGSSDMGDLSCIMPTIQPHGAGAVGKCHGNDYFIKDSKKATLDTAKLQLAMLWLLLSNGAERAKKIISEFTPRFASKDEYLSYVQSIFKKGDRITYNEDGTATVEL